MTDEIAARDAYQRSVDTVVERVDEDGIVLARTVFYPRGGGQPGDTGWIRWPSGQVEITDTVRRQGRLLHVFRGDPPPEAVEVTAEIDWERRHLLMRTHTALHSLSAIIWRDFDAKVTGGNMEPGTARMDFELEGISVEFGQQVEDKLNEELQADHPVEILFLPRAEALADPDLIRTKINLLPDFIDPIRIVNIVGLDKQADGGTHVATTQEVGRVRVVKTESKGKANKRIRIELA